MSRGGGDACDGLPAFWELSHPRAHTRDFTETAPNASSRHHGCAGPRSNPTASGKVQHNGSADPLASDTLGARYPIRYPFSLATACSRGDSRTANGLGTRWGRQ